MARTRGDAGWVPQFVLPDLDVENLIWGVGENGQKNLLPNTLSESQWDGESAVYRYYYIDETSDARELDPEDLVVITDHALAVWLEDQRVLIENYQLRFDSDIFEWIGTQVLNTNIAVEGTATPLPGAGPIDIGDLLGGGN